MTASATFWSLDLHQLSCRKGVLTERINIPSQLVGILIPASQHFGRVGSDDISLIFLLFIGGHVC